MRRISNVVFTCIVALLIVSPLGYIAANGLLPDIVKAPVESELENRVYSKPPALDPVEIASGKVQDQCESFVADHIPNRDGYLLANAAIQRSSIALSAGIMGYDIYPTYFESNYYVIPADEVIVGNAQARPEKKEKKWSRAGMSTLNDAAKKHPEMSFVYDCVVRHDQCTVNPTFDLLSGKKVTANWIKNHLLDKLDPSLILSYPRQGTTPLPPSK